MDKDTRVFEALAGPTRRLLLDRLFEQDGQRLSDLATGVDMTRFGVMKHLRVLEAAGLVTSRKVGREKFHYLNPVPIQMIYQRYVHKFAHEQAAALLMLKAALERREGGRPLSTATRQVYHVFIKATPDAVWQAITTPEFTRQYFYGSSIAVTPERYHSSAPDGSLWMDESVKEWDPPRRLVHGWRFQGDPDMAQEGLSRVTWEIEVMAGGVSKLTVIHDQLDGAPKTAEMVAGGWMYVLSGLKTVLETGAPLASH